MVSRSTIYWKNLALEEDTTVSGTGDFLKSAENASKLPVGLIARKEGTTVSLQVDLGSAKQLLMISLLKTNLSPTAQLNVRLSAVSAGGSEILNTGSQPAGVLEGYSDVYYDVDPGLDPVRYVSLDVTDPFPSVPAGSVDFIDVGLLGLYDDDGCWAPTVNELVGRSFGYEHPNAIRGRSIGNTLVTVRRRPVRAVRMELRYNFEAEMVSNALEVDRVAGVTGHVLMALDRDNNPQTHTFYGVIRDSTPLVSWSREGRVSKAYTIEEV